MTRDEAFDATIKQLHKMQQDPSVIGVSAHVYSLTNAGYLVDISGKFSPDMQPREMGIAGAT